VIYIYIFGFNRWKSSIVPSGSKKKFRTPKPQVRIPNEDTLFTNKIEYVILSSKTKLLGETSYSKNSSGEK